MTIFLIIAGILSLFALLLSDLSWNNVLSSERNDLVFQDRNRAYGAYPLRREHHRVMVLAFGAAIVLFGTALGVPKLIPRGPELPPHPPAPVDSSTWVDFGDRIDPEKKVEKERVQPRSHDEGPYEAIDSSKTAVIDSTAHDPAIGDPNGDVPRDTTGSGTGGTRGGGGIVPVDPSGPTVAPEFWPEFPGGLDALQDFFGDETRFTSDMLEGHDRVKVYVEFVIDQNGKVVLAKMMKGFNRQLDQSVMRAVDRMPEWKPGRMGDKPVSVRFTLPIVFRVR